ncbi:unnamed protein product [Lampetra planeri]
MAAVRITPLARGAWKARGAEWSGGDLGNTEWSSGDLGTLTGGGPGKRGAEFSSRDLGNTERSETVGAWEREAVGDLGNAGRG